MYLKDNIAAVKVSSKNRGSFAICLLNAEGLTISKAMAAAENISRKAMIYCSFKMRSLRKNRNKNAHNASSPR